MPVLALIAPLKVMPGWPEASYSPFHVILLCVLLPLLTAAVFIAVGLAGKGRLERRRDELASGLADPAETDPQTEERALVAGPHRGLDDRVLDEARH
ncbi:hypothetical protein [Acidipropionibacterium timonense]|uniref:hypothetical protein n=1 Tax=Acidipropionibacterium timonense TaxID=2161818 RepID=UPI001031CB15|nr:hypothetical protein [Acidipropionibacterium timonense]